MNKSPFLFTLLATVGCSFASVQAQDVPVLVNGAPWLVNAPNGMEVQMTFNPDGSGQVRAGIFSNGVSWSVQNGTFCIDGVPGGGSCMALTVNGNTVIGVAADGNQFIFRPA